MPPLCEEPDRLRSSSRGREQRLSPRPPTSVLRSTASRSISLRLFAVVIGSTSLASHPAHVSRARALDGGRSRSPHEAHTLPQHRRARLFARMQDPLLGTLPAPTVDENCARPNRATDPLRGRAQPASPRLYLRAAPSPGLNRGPCSRRASVQRQVGAGHAVITAPAVLCSPSTAPRRRRPPAGNGR